MAGSRKEGGLPPTVDRALGAYVLNLDNNEVVPFHQKLYLFAAEALGKCICTHPIPTLLLETALRWDGGLVRLWQIWSLSSFIRPCLYHPQARNFLISEALRGAGGKLRRRDGVRFMLHYDERAELAPRDIVARSIDAELKKSGEECVYLDMHHLSREELQRQFPNIHEGMFEAGH